MIDIKSKEISIIKIEDIKENPKNRNKHPREQIDELKKIIQYQGFRNPLTISNRTGLLVAGHGRLIAAKELEFKSLPVIYQDFDSEEQEYAAGIADNAISSWAELDLSGINMDLPDLGPDFDIAMLGIKDFILEPIEKLDPGCDEDDAPEAPKESVVKLGDLFELGNHRLLCGDSTSIDAVERLMKKEVVELCFTSPPYADQREYNGEKELSTEHLATFIRAAYGKVNYFAVNLGYSRKSGEVNPYWDDYIKEAKECGLKLLSWNVWDRSGMGGSIGNQTAFFPIWHEWIFIFGAQAKELNRTKPNKSAGSKSGTNRQADGSLKKSSGNITPEFGKIGTVTACGVADGKLHPAMFPVELPEKYIEAITDNSDSVYEPFGGSGSTLIACEKTNRKCFMMELDPLYISTIIERWQTYSKKKAYLMNEDGTQTPYDELKGLNGQTKKED